MAVRPFGGVWRLSYVDLFGPSSERVVETISIADYKADCVLIAYCRQQQDVRAFWVSRIVAMEEEGTGRQLRKLGGVRFLIMAKRNEPEAKRYLANEAQGYAYWLTLEERWRRRRGP